MFKRETILLRFSVALSANPSDLALCGCLTESVLGWLERGETQSAWDHERRHERGVGVERDVLRLERLLFSWNNDDGAWGVFENGLSDTSYDPFPNGTVSVRPDHDSVCFMLFGEMEQGFCRGALDKERCDFNAGIP